MRIFWVDEIFVEKAFFLPCFLSVNNQLQLSIVLRQLVQEGCLEGRKSDEERMPQLDKFTYVTQFFWLCLGFLTYYIPICNDRDGVLGIGIILKLRNQLLSHRGNKIQSKDLPQKDQLEEVSIKGFSTGVSYMSSTFFEVSQWCKAVDILGKKRKITLISSFGEISGSRGMERNILYLISKSSESSSLLTCRNDIMLIHVPHGQGSIVFSSPPLCSERLSRARFWDPICLLVSAFEMPNSIRRPRGQRFWERKPVSPAIAVRPCVYPAISSPVTSEKPISRS